MKNTEEQTILLIEDNPGDVRLMKEMLKEITSLNYQLNVAETLKEGCERIKSNNIILILLDLNLPDSIGKQTFDTVIGLTQSIPVVLVSGINDVELSTEIIKEGAQDFILKKDLNNSLLGKTIQFALLRKKSEEDLKASADQLNFALEANHTGAWSLNLEDGTATRNLIHDQIFGYQTLLPKWTFNMFLEHVHPGDRANVESLFREATASNANLNFECRIIRADGELRWIKVSGTQILNRITKQLLLSGLVCDITESKKAEQKLIKAKEKAEESDRLKTAFLCNMSHEIRTPMNGILGFSELLKEPGLTNEQQNEYIRIIQKSGARMLNIISEIMDISKIEAGLIEVNIKELNIYEQLEYIYTLLKPDAEAKKLNISLINSLHNKEVIINTDNEKFCTILSNLVKNAIKYTDEGFVEFGISTSSTTESVSEPIEMIQFYVKDTGIGIPKNKQVVIFDRFMQAEITDVMARQGAGLGLAISKAYAEKLGGKIWVESEEGKGSTFYFTLPYNPESEEKKVVEKVVSVQDQENQIKDLKILIAEDDETSDLFISSIFKTNKQNVLHAKTGSETIELCRNNPDLDLILMDIRMPEMDGYEATRQIRQFNKNVIIIAQTAYGLSGDREKAIEAGCNEYISKPINKDELLLLIQKYFKK